MKTQDKILVSIGTVAVVAFASVVGYELFTTGDNQAATTATASSQAQPSTTTQTQNTPASTTTSASSSGYKDGSYTASASYEVPRGNQNNISATVAVSGGKVTNVSVNDDYSDRESAQYISFFEQEISSAVVGQSLGDVSVSRVGGASLTSSGFDDVLDTVRMQAKA